MPAGKETRLLHLAEMEKLDKTLFRLEQGRSGGRGRVRRKRPGHCHWMAVQRDLSMKWWSFGGVRGVVLVWVWLWVGLVSFVLIYFHCRALWAPHAV